MYFSMLPPKKGWNGKTSKHNSSERKGVYQHANRSAFSSFGHLTFFNPLKLIFTDHGGPSDIRLRGAYA